ncbi:hypothetical protein AVEN_203747-1 [Araneus ventricosus]|uniref:Uncharacterized protein n=1 Tax=Araneus ventricosus TaxID=182803 RepID=A0A4Y2GCS2_ARAVE|nr:hypothetical protein AVEN_203747-1 [Araneus ventricosus]
MGIDCLPGRLSSSNMRDRSSCLWKTVLVPIYGDKLPAWKTVLVPICRGISCLPGRLSWIPSIGDCLPGRLSGHNIWGCCKLSSICGDKLPAWKTILVQYMGISYAWKTVCSILRISCLPGRLSCSI